MTDLELQCLLDLSMCCDPWPVHNTDGTIDKANQATITSLLNKEAQTRGFDNWVSAYHQLCRRIEAGKSKLEKELAINGKPICVFCGTNETKNKESR
jgi:hypothetical protein